VKDFEKLELSTETLREITPDELARVGGGQQITSTCPMATQTPVCPSGATWFAPCNTERM
jgi:hypothetical protein